MRAPSTWQAVPLALGLAAGCYNDDYLLGAYCVRDGDCGEDQCCAGPRCRPLGDCDRPAGTPRPFEPAYRSCDSDEQCLEHGLPSCARWPGAPVGFCTDYCSFFDVTRCENHTEGYPQSQPRACVDIDGKSICALACEPGGQCPMEMMCVAEVCVPVAP